MKKITYLLLGVLLCLTSCFKDEGNYDYTQINEVTIEGIEVNAVYEAGSQIVATPTITVLDEATSNLRSVLSRSVSLTEDYETADYWGNLISIEEME